VAFYHYIGLVITVPLPWPTIAVGLVTGLVVPLVSNIYPIKQALNQSLRDALDRFRSGVDEQTVEFIRSENMGFSWVQVTLASTILATSALTLYFIPRSLMDIDPAGTYYRLNLLLLGCIIGVIFLGQAFA